jgi:hypothetical protein
LISIDDIPKLPNYDSDDDSDTRENNGDRIDCHKYRSGTHVVATTIPRRNPHQADIQNLVNAGYTVIVGDDGNRKEWLPVETVPYPMPGGEFEII